MKTLDEMRNDFVVYSKSTGSEIDISKYADVIEKEIDKYYLPRPLFEDGEPVQFHDKVSNDEKVFMVHEITYVCDGRVLINPYYDHEDMEFNNGDKLKRPSEPDTQLKINCDVFTVPDVYCKKHNIPIKDICDDDELSGKKIMHLLERQRKVCETKS